MRVRKVLQAVLSLLGRDRKKLKSWPEVKKAVQPGLVDEMAAIHAEAAPIASKARRAASRALEGVEIDAILDAPFPIQNLFKFVVTTLDVCALEAEQRGVGRGQGAALTGEGATNGTPDAEAERGGASMATATLPALAAAC